MKNVIFPSTSRFSGDNVNYVLKHNPQYIEWCLNNDRYIYLLSNPFEKGDNIIMNRLADKHYIMTTTGNKYQVVEVSGSSLKIIGEDKEEYTVKWFCCFLNETREEILPFACNSFVKGTSRALINRLIKGKKFFFEDGVSINILKIKTVKYLYFLNDDRVFIATKEYSFTPTTSTEPKVIGKIDLTKTKPVATTDILNW